jgi:hypothetical protein
MSLKALKKPNTNKNMNKGKLIQSTEVAALSGFIFGFEMIWF